MGVHCVVRKFCFLLVEYFLIMVKEVALVIGGTSGIGKEQVYRWVKEGYEVVFCGRNETEGTKISKESNSTFIKCDITIVSEVEEMFKTVKSKFGRLDVLFNNAGFAASGGRLHNIPMESVRTMMEVNLLGAWHVLKYGLGLMVECGNGGRVVNTSTIVAITAAAALFGTSHYASAKAALVNMTQTAAIEYISDRIRINAVAPTGIETPMLRDLIKNAEDPEAMQQGVNKLNPIAAATGQMAQYSDVTGVVSFLCGPDAKFINGQTIAIDGGYSIQ